MNSLNFLNALIYLPKVYKRKKILKINNLF